MKRKEVLIEAKESEVLKLIKDELYNFNNKFLHLQDGCIYFIIEDVVYGFSHLKLETGNPIYSVWFEDCDYQIKLDDETGENILVKSHPTDFMLLEYDELLELYTLINMEVKLQSTGEK